MNSKLLLLSFFLLLFNKLDAHIKYTQVTPNVTISATVSMVFDRYDLDLNNDGTIDFYIKHFHPDTTTQQAEFYTQIGQAGEVLVDTGTVPFALNAGDNISSSQSTWVDYAGASFSSALVMNANWAGKSDKYVGLRIQLGGHWYYGWIRLTIPSDVSKIIVKDYAVNEVADSSIKAGQTVGTDISSFEKQQSVMIYPNPMKYLLVIEDAEIGSDFSVQNIMGQVVYHGIITKEKETLNTQNMAQGIYIVHIRNSGTKEIIIVKK